MAMSLKHHQSNKKSPQLILLLTVLVTVWFIKATITVQIGTISNTTNDAMQFCDKNITNFEIIDIFQLRKEEPKNFKSFLVLVRFRIDMSFTIKRRRNRKIRRIKRNRCLIELRSPSATESLPRIVCHSNTISQLIIDHLRDGATIRRLHHTNLTLSERQQNSTKIIKTTNPLWIKFNNKINDHSFKKLIGCDKVRSKSTTIDKNVDPITETHRSSSQNGQEDSKKMRTWTTGMMMITGIFEIKYRGEDKKQVKESLKIGHIIGIVAVVVSCLVIGVILYCCLCHRKPPRVTKKTSGGGSGHHKPSHH